MWLQLPCFEGLNSCPLLSVCEDTGDIAVCAYACRVQYLFRTRLHREAEEERRGTGPPSLYAPPRVVFFHEQHPLDMTFVSPEGADSSESNASSSSGLAASASSWRAAAAAATGRVFSSESEEDGLCSGSECQLLCLLFRADGCCSHFSVQVGSPACFVRLLHLPPAAPSFLEEDAPAAPCRCGRGAEVTCVHELSTRLWRPPRGVGGCLVVGPSEVAWFRGPPGGRRTRRGEESLPPHRLRGSGGGPAATVHLPPGLEDVAAVVGLQAQTGDARGARCRDTCDFLLANSCGMLYVGSIGLSRESGGSSRGQGGKGSAAVADGGCQDSRRGAGKTASSSTDHSLLRVYYAGKVNQLDALAWLGGRVVFCQSPSDDSMVLRVNPTRDSWEQPEPQGRMTILERNTFPTQTSLSLLQAIPNSGAVVDCCMGDFDGCGQKQVQTPFLRGIGRPSL